MQLTVQGKQIEVGDALREHVTQKLQELRNKYFNRVIEANVTFAREGHAFFKCSISIRVGRDILVQATATEADPYQAFEGSAEKIGKQLRRYKTRLRDHHDRLDQTPESEEIKARDFVLATAPHVETEEDESGVPHGEDPVIIAELTTNIQTMSVSEAVMRMDLAGQPALLFRNASHNGINMVYRRPDGNVGWIDPVAQEDAAARKKTA